jgi:hypothetical protein
MNRGGSMDKANDIGFIGPSFDPEPFDFGPPECPIVHENRLPRNVSSTSGN